MADYATKWQYLEEFFCTLNIFYFFAKGVVFTYLARAGVIHAYRDLEYRGHVPSKDVCPTF